MKEDRGKFFFFNLEQEKKNSHRPFLFPALPPFSIPIHIHIPIPIPIPPSTAVLSSTSQQRRPSSTQRATPGTLRSGTLASSSRCSASGSRKRATSRT